MPAPAIAVLESSASQGTGAAVDAAFRSIEGREPTETVEFDWSKVAPLRNYRGARNWYRFLRWTAANMGETARLGLEFSAHDLDGILGGLQLRLHRLLQWVIAVLVAAWVVMRLGEWVVLMPAAWYGLPTATFVPARWIAWAMGWVQTGLVAGMAVLLLLGTLRLGLTFSPRPAIVTIRSMVMLLLQPPMMFVVAALLAGPVVLTVVFGVLGAVTAVENGLGVGAFIPLGLILAAVLVARARWARTGLSGPVRVAVDAFRYLGESGCRARVQRALDKAIQETRERHGVGKEVVVLGHGLGSIIALDCVSHSKVWRVQDRVLLVTMGSPLRRIFLRLYPRTLFPESMDDLVDVIAGRLAKFRWINVYRPWDYLGAALGLGSFHGRDISTLQRDRVLDNHVGYWRDLEVRRSMVRGLQRLEEVEPLRVPMKDAAHRLPSPAQPSPPWEMPPRLRSVLGIVAAIGAFAGMAWWVSTGSGLLTPPPEEPPELLREGVVAEATATHRRETVELDRGVTYVHHWAFAFADRTGTPQTIEVETDASDAFVDVPRPRFDEWSMLHYIRNSGCEGAGDGAGAGSAIEDPCSVAGVQVRYYPGDITMFELPDFPRRSFTERPPGDWAEAGIAAAILTVLLLVPLWLGVRSFALLRG